LPVSSGEDVENVGEESGVAVPPGEVRLSGTDQGGADVGLGDDDVKIPPVESVCPVAQPSQAKVQADQVPLDGPAGVRVIEEV